MARDIDCIMLGRYMLHSIFSRDSSQEQEGKGSFRTRTRTRTPNRIRCYLPSKSTSITASV